MHHTFTLEILGAIGVVTDEARFKLVSSVVLFASVSLLLLVNFISWFVERYPIRAIEVLGYALSNSQFVQN